MGALAQIKIGGNVYGGGNSANVQGSTKVTVRQGDLNKVFGGARMADVGGNTYVNIDGKNASGYTIINYVFGGNDIAGTIGTAKAVGESLPAELTSNTDDVTDEWNSYVHLSTKATPAVYYTQAECDEYNTANNLTSVDEGYRTTSDIKTPAVTEEEKTFIGQLFAGGNGDYYYEDEQDTPEAGKVTHKIFLKEDDATPIATKVTNAGEAGFTLPELNRTYLDVQGGTIAFAHGGGNNATVHEKAVIHVDNPSAVVNHIYVDPATGLENKEATENSHDGTEELLTDNRIKENMGIRMMQEHIDSPDFQIGRLFGGNNKADMAIRPTWNLQSGKIRNLYSGGNRGAMTSFEGLLLELDPKVPEGLSYEAQQAIKKKLVVDNVYGGCRMADVRPTKNGADWQASNLEGYSFPNGLSARVLIRGGDINNVYGGNDVTGKVYGGNAIGIYTSIRGNVYGGGNGSYAYTDNETYKDGDYGDFYYEGSVYDLNAYRPNAEQVSIRLKGTDAAHPTIIGGAVFCGGNCATLATNKDNPLVELKIGSHVIADQVFLGNNGAGMIEKDILRRYAGTLEGTEGFSSLILTDGSVFAGYMEGVAMNLKPKIVFDSRENGDNDDYVDFTSKIGSFYCGGNVGSMTTSGKTTFSFDRGLIIFDKLVGGCNSADVEELYDDDNKLCAAYKGGLLGSNDERGDSDTDYYTDTGLEGGKIKDRLELSLDNVTIEPHRWNDTFEAVTAADLEEGKLKAGETYYTTKLRSSEFVAKGTETVNLDAADKYYKLTEKGTTLEWNTAFWSNDEGDFMPTGTGGTGEGTDGTGTANDDNRRLLGGNVYGGCYNSGHVNGNVTININQNVIRKEVVFAEADDKDSYAFKPDGVRNSGVLLDLQAEDLMTLAMTVFGAGCGKQTEIWGSTTVNLNNGYAFQIFGGGEEGVVGKKNDSGKYEYKAAYSTTVNMNGPNAGYSDEETGPALAEAEYIYGGGNEGDVCGDSRVYLGNGRLYGAFGGASNADIFGGTEMYIGYNGGFPWIGGNVYAGNDFGGSIKGKINHTTSTTRTPFDANLLQSSTYMKYLQGRVDSIFGGNYGSYDYTDPMFRDYTYTQGETLPEGKSYGDPKDGFSFPHLEHNSFVHFVPSDNSGNSLAQIFGGSEGYPGNVSLNDAMQKECYVLIDDTQTKDADRYANVDIYGGGAFAGTGTPETLGAGRTAVDLFAGSFHNVYGGCNQEGLVGYTRVNVPSGSTVKVNALFGGGQGYSHEMITKTPALAARYCDHYVTCIDFQSTGAIVEDAIYGGNHNSRIACDTYINMQSPALQSNGYQATIYGAGYGAETVSGRTNVFMNNGSKAYKVFGGGRDGNAFNFVSLQHWLGNQFITAGSTPDEAQAKVGAYGDILRNFSTYLASNPISLPALVGTYVNESGTYDGNHTNDIMTNPDYHQTNVHLMNGSNVTGYAYGGGYGTDAVVSGTTFLELKGGTVDRDIYGGGQGGHVYDEYGLKNASGAKLFTAATNVVIEGGTARNVYGGGYQGHVGKHTGDISASYSDDIPGVANVTIGKVDGTSFYNGVPAIQRNAYGGGEGGSVYGTANITLNNGYIGYRYKNTAESGAPSNYQYVEELDDQTANAIEMAGNVFGGGYVVNSYVDNANINMFGGIVRGSLYGGGELGAIGAGTMNNTFSTGTGIVNGTVRIFRPGKTLVRVYDGHVKRNVFGGGRGQDSWGGDGTKYMDKSVVASLNADGLFCKGYVFGQTEVDIFGGEVGTDEGVAQGYGNVFGGGDIGFVYSAYKKDVYFTQAEIDAASDGDPAYGKTTSDVKTPGVLCIGKKPEGSVRYDGADEGYYYKYEKEEFATSGTEKILTEDCKVVVEPWCRAKNDITINSEPYAAGTYVPTSALNYLGNKNDADWATFSKPDVNKEGIIIHNAVFAGGNTSPGSTEIYANTPTVFGNATASIHDVYNRDLISIGRGRVGGLYGDGNLTLVDGYRELNITNYGTDYYHITPEITLEQYNALPNREAAYYEIRYKCLQQCTDKNGKVYAVGSTITADEMVNVFDGVTVTVDGVTVNMLQANDKPLDTYWVENGVCSRYAGRPMNTIQRADFCGVFGSRMVMMGAQDRVPETVDYTNYTINRVREVSLNKKVSLRTADASDARNKEHGNYFGIYSVVNFLGALTSDVDFHTAVRVTDNSDTGTYQGEDYGTATYYDWKAKFHDERKRNNGSSHNKLALASGVYLELTSEKSRGKDLYDKDWGLITGVVELDLINVQPGMGGGYVYAKNAHGIRSSSGKTQTILTSLNTGAVTNKQFKYDETEDTKKEWETSGNFVHSTQTIIDDCYNQGAKYLSGYNKPDGVPAHYWFIKGAVYIYDQYISAYTGSPNAFSEKVSIPLTITSASHGRLTLLNVQPNRYAYYSVNQGSTQTPLGEDKIIELRDKEYGRNDAINYWDYSQLTDAEKKLFVKETYVVTADCTYGDGETPTTYKAGTVLLPSEYESLKAAAPTKDFNKDDELTIMTPYVHHVAKDMDVDFDDVFRPSNNVSHDEGYILTYTVDNPNQWNTWYTPKNGTSLTGKKDSKEIASQTLSDYEDGPTYTPITTGMYGQNEYNVGNIIPKSDYDTYQDVVTNHSGVILSGQASFHPAYIVTADVLETTNKNGTAQRFHKGATLSKEDYTDATWASISSSVAEAYVATSTIQLANKTDYIYRNTYMTLAEKNALKAANSSLASQIESSVVPAYYCTSAGKYGGNYYETGHNYRALAAYTAMSESDRANFKFNYDALDLLIDPTFGRAEGFKYQYDVAPTTDKDNDDKITVLDLEESDANANKATYSLKTPIDYSATYKGTESFTYKDDSGNNQTIKTDGTSVLTRTEYERLPNEQYYYAPISVTDASEDYYVVKETIVLGDTPYAAGQVITSDTYDGLSAADKEKVTTLNFTSTGTYYYCREGYTINSSNYTGEFKGTVRDILKTENNVYETTVPAGIVITSVNYSDLINRQANFSIHGLAPTETSSLYVTRNSDILDLSAEKIITVIYQYDYVESDMAGAHITPVSERHVLNIHLNFKSGVPSVEDIMVPDIVLPGTTLSIPEPHAEPGASEITRSGWVLYDNEPDAESHTNGTAYNPSLDPLYLYQNKYYLAYYAGNYQGLTYSNHVPISVANYHDLKDVMSDNLHHYYIDHKDVHDVQKVEPKIYIRDYTTDNPATSQNGLDLFKNLYDLSIMTSSSSGVAEGVVTTGTLKDHHLLDASRVGAGQNLEFFLRTDIDHGPTPNPNPGGDPIEHPWTPIASGGDPCFNGTLHGDGHTISGLDHSLFGKLCGSVYNLGVTGSFTGAGVADEGYGYVESCWVKSSVTSSDASSKPYAVFGNPTDGTGYQVVNSYFWEGNSDLYNTTTTANGVTTSGGERGTARAMTSKEFYNGTVAYDLNNFYLYKRYNDHETSSGPSYSYFEADGEGTLQKKEGKYVENAALCSSGFSNFKYVEDRFADGDFRFDGGADGGVIPAPNSQDERYFLETVTNSETGVTSNEVRYYPIWPDDYIFFGQKLTYGHSASQPHQEVPTAVARFNGRLSQNEDANRVYRAPAYFRSKEMSSIHFNPHAYLAAKSEDGTKEAYPGLTAIDFKGHYYTPYEIYGAYRPGADGADKPFYPPLLDDDGLLSIVNCDETQNLLVYAPAQTATSGYANKKTYDALTGYFVDPAYSDYYIDDKYRRVDDATSATGSVYGHLVKDNLTATTDHLLVDKQDFNCPIAYSFDGSHRMWYQRKPELDEENGIYEFVDRAKGWQGISIPFTAELVTTNDKGEITHFYSGSETSKNGTGTKIGHEYWLRRFTSGGSEETVEGKKTYKANMVYPDATGSTKTVDNTFLWDYYYENTAVHNQQDKNDDTYQTYYESSRPYLNYPLLAGGTPYLLGLPGETYYEFDLSGSFEAKNTKVSIDKLGKQTITFASEPGKDIRVSDDEMADVTVDGYTFMPNYMCKELAAYPETPVAGTYNTNYVLNADGSSYELVAATATNAVPFRPYFTGTITAPVSPSREVTRSIVFSQNGAELGDGGNGDEDPGTLSAHAERHKIVVSSTKRYATDVRIVNTAGQVIASFTLSQGETVETPINNAGIFIVQEEGGRFIKKMAVE